MLGRGEIQRERVERRTQLLRPAWADDDRGHVRVCQQPGERERGRRRRAACGLRLERLERVEHAVLLQVQVRLRPQGHARPGGRLFAALVLACEPTAGERAERREAEPFARTQLEHSLLGVAVEQRVRVLHPVRTPVAKSLLEPRHVDVAAAVGPDLPLGDERVERADRLGHRYRRIHRMDEIERDRLDAEPLEAALELAADPFTRQAVVGAVAHRVERLRRQDDPVAHVRPFAAQPAADERLAAAAAVGVRRVERRDPGLPGSVHDHVGFALGLTGAEVRGRGTETPEVAAAEDDAGHLDPAAAERTLLHTGEVS